MSKCMAEVPLTECVEEVELILIIVRKELTRPRFDIILADP